MEMGLVQTMEARGRGRPVRGGAEYLLVVYPDGDMQYRLLDEQQQFAADYGLEHRLDQGMRGANLDQGMRGANNILARNKPHITLAAFQASDEAEDTLIRWIQRICHERRSFRIALNNYSGMPPHTTEQPEAARVPGTIYLRVQDPEPLRELIRQLGAIDEYVRSSGWPPVQLARRPYISIAGGLTEQVYNKAMPDYSRKTFHGSFEVSELVLLKRKHSFDPCKTVNVFGLKN